MVIIDFIKSLNLQELLRLTFRLQAQYIKINLKMLPTITVKKKLALCPFYSLSLFVALFQTNSKKALKPCFVLPDLILMSMTSHQTVFLSCYCTFYHVSIGQQCILRRLFEKSRTSSMQELSKF